MPIVTGLLPAFVAGALVQMALAMHVAGGRGYLAAPVVVVAVALGIAGLTRLQRAAWLVAAAGVAPMLYLMAYRYQLFSPRYPGLVLVAVFAFAGLILAGPLLALRSPVPAVRLGVAAGFAAGLATGALFNGVAFHGGVDGLGPASVGGVLVLLAAGVAALRTWPSTVDSSRAWPALLLSATTGAALAGVLYWLHQTHVLPGGDDVPYRTGPHSVQIWAWSLGLGLAVTVTLTALAYRLAGPDGAGWTVGLSVLAYPAVAVSGPYLIDGPVSGPARAVAGCVGVGLGVLLVSRVDGRPPWAALGLLTLGVVVLVPSAPPWLVVGLAGLAVGAALTRLARHTGPALGAVGVGVAAWLYDVRALGPIVDVDPPRPVLVAWLLAGVVTLFAVQSRVPASRLVERVQDPRLG